MLIGLGTAAAAIALDQASKGVIFGYLAKTQPVVEVTPFFNLVSAWNTGVSFSMFNNLGGDGVYILSAFSLLVVGFLLYWLKRENDLAVQISLGLVIGGAIGNVLDRIRLGAVFDFLDLHCGGYHWPAFNLADSFICIGALLIVFDGFLNGRRKEQGERAENGGKSRPGAAGADAGANKVKMNKREGRQ